MKKLFPMILGLAILAAPRLTAEQTTSFEGSMAIPMLLFTGAGLQGDGNSTGLAYSFGQDGGDVYQTFGYSFIRPWQLLGRKVRAEAVWLAPLDWWTADALDMNDEPYPGIGAQLTVVLYEGHLIPGKPGGGGTPPKLPTTIALNIGTTFNMEREEVEAHIGLNLIRFLF